mmetsp:Transcript_4718/g.13339  ORF Transcript_4718/g.13339 Transcript_4718/m.13339 type:complete len:315 (-) Transcript_4718:416-1360(-)
MATGIRSTWRCRGYGWSRTGMRVVMTMLGRGRRSVGVVVAVHAPARARKGTRAGSRARAPGREGAGGRSGLLVMVVLVRRVWMWVMMRVVGLMGLMGLMTVGVPSCPLLLPEPFLFGPLLILLGSLLLLLLLLLLGGGRFLLGLLLRLELLPQLRQVLPQSLRRLLPGLDVADVVPVPVLGVAVEEPPRRVLVADLLDDGLGDEALLPLEPRRQVHPLPLLDELPVLGVARVGVDGAAPAAQDVAVVRLARRLGGRDGVERPLGDLAHRQLFVHVRRRRRHVDRRTDSINIVLTQSISICQRVSVLRSISIAVR